MLAAFAAYTAARRTPHVCSRLRSKRVFRLQNLHNPPGGTLLPARLVVPRFREVLATGIRFFAIALMIRTDGGKARSTKCHGCLRFRKNALKQRSPLFNWLDGYLNPLFNRARDSLLTPQELEQARALARSRADPDFAEPAAGTPLAVLMPIQE